MKRLIPFIMVLLGLTSVYALEPCPLAFKFITSPSSANEGLTVTLEYYGQVWTVPETYPGEYVIELGTEDIPNCISTNFMLTVKDCKGNPSCRRTVSFNPDGYTTIDISNVNLFPTTTIQPTTTVTTTTILEECYTESECLEICQDYCEECPDLTIEFLLTMIFSIISGGFLVYAKGGKLHLKKENLEKIIELIPKGCGLRLFRPYIGKAELKHFHRSPKRYHNLSDRHKEKYDHEGEKNLFPDLEEG